LLCFLVNSSEVLFGSLIVEYVIISIFLHRCDGWVAEDHDSVATSPEKILRTHNCVLVCLAPQAFQTY
jgi:hypothetical protein